MLKSLAVLCVFAIGMSGKPNDAGGNKDGVANNHQSAPISTYTYDANCCTTQASQKPDEKPQRWYTSLERPDWWLVIAAFVTLYVVGRQTRETRRAAEAAATSAAATLKQVGHMKTQADLMEDQLESARQKERPKLRIELDEVDLSLASSPDMLLIGSKIKNYGGSVAFVAGNIYICWIAKTTDDGDQPSHTGFPMVLPEVLLPGDKSYNPGMFLPDEKKAVDFTMWDRSDPRIESLRKGESSIYLSGFLMYENIFEETWILSFKRKFTVHRYERFSVGKWSREGDDQNYERLKLSGKTPEPSNA